MSGNTLRCYSIFYTGRESLKKTLVGNERVGKLIRLNQKVLTPGKKEYASIVFWGDVHYGHPQCDIERATGMLDYCLKHHIYVVAMGDLIECGLRDSVGDSVYNQKLNPQGQMEFMIELLKPLAEAGLLLGIHEGNHENRITKNTGVNITKIMCKMLDVPYLGYAIWHLIRVGKQNYTMYTTHGSSGSRFKHTKLKAVMDIAMFFEADVVAMGHVHSRAIEPMHRQRVNLRNRTVEDRRILVVLSGAYLTYDKSYAQMKGYPPASLGSSKIQLRADRWSVHASV